MGAVRFWTRKYDLWADLDSFRRSEGWEESDSEAQSHDAIVEEEIRWKETEVKKVFGSEDGLGRSVEPEGARQNINEVGQTIQDGPGLAVEGGHSTVALSQPQASSSTSEVYPSFHRSHILQTSTPHLKDISTYPEVPTPGIVNTPMLPSPLKQVTMSKSSPIRRKTTMPTPDNVPSPIDTPDSSCLTRSIGEGRGRRDDPGTPIPLGTAAYSKLRGKKDYQMLTKHFEVFTKTVSKQEAGVSGTTTRKGKGRAVEKSPSTTVLGGKVFEGLRFCIPPELNQVTKHKQRWDVVSFPMEDHGLMHLDLQARRSGHSAARYRYHACRL